LVNVHRQALVEAASDEEALELFRQQWIVYQKLIDHDYLDHVDAYGTLHRTLTRTIDRPFSLLDLACGDAAAMVRALRGTRVAHYHGVDLAAPALELARDNLDALGCAVELEQRDFVEAMRDRPEPADVVWIGLSLHHLEAADKRTLMSEIRGVVGERGCFLIYEPACYEGEDLGQYFERYERVARHWTALTPVEWNALLTHVRTCDVPETVSSWLALGHDAGFAAAEVMFTASSELFRIFCYRAQPPVGACVRRS
jgi:ubiquinone/menaquinone biosynthesis C-methylase UbiE